MEVGDEFEYNGKRYVVEKEKSEFSCDGCVIGVILSKGQHGCGARSTDKIFGSCKHDHVIFKYKKA